MVPSQFSHACDQKSPSSLIPLPLSLLLPRLLADPLPIITDPVPRTTADPVPCTTADPLPRTAADLIPLITADTAQYTAQLQMISLKSARCLIACYVSAAFDIVHQTECSSFR